MKFKVGDKVQVVKKPKTVLGSPQVPVAGRVGTVVNNYLAEMPLVYFLRFKGGHSGDGSRGQKSKAFWYVATENLRKVKK